MTAADDSEAAMRTSSVLAEEAIATAEAADVTAEAADVTAEAAEVAAEAEGITAEAADAHDDAILDMIAFEMAAEDPSDSEDSYPADADEIHVAELAPADPIVVAPEPEPMAVAAEPQAVQPSLQPALAASVEPSLGASLIARGILSRPAAAGSDPMAPIRRMSQAEKIAFFS